MPLPNNLPYETLLIYYLLLEMASAALCVYFTFGRVYGLCHRVAYYPIWGSGWTYVLRRRLGLVRTIREVKYEAKQSSSLSVLQLLSGLQCYISGCLYF